MDTSDISSSDEGVVYKKTIGAYFVHPIHQPGAAIACELAPSLRMELAAPLAAASTDSRRTRQASKSLAVGDRVQFVSADAGSGLIVAVHPRRSQFSRRASTPHDGGHGFEQVIAANLDQVVPVFAAASPAPHWNLLDRYLVAAESAGLPAQICITKLDLVRGDGVPSDPAILAIAEEYRRIGYPVHLVSAVTGEGMEGLREALQGRISALLGKSGVGKTSLLSALQPGLSLPVGEVSRATGKGRHTTSWLEMVDLDSGGAILDTPGIREFGLWDVDPDELAGLFPEMRPWVGRCRFGLGCRHDEEPGCAVRRAVMAGQVSPRRYHSYLRMREDGGRR